MTNISTTIRLGTRGSALARWQTDHVARLLRDAWPEKNTETIVFSTRGDQIIDTPLPLIGGKGLFTTELEHALREGIIDLAVHSLKDLPTEDPDRLALGAVPQRANPADVLISRKGYTLETLPRYASVGTSSRRRAAQLLAHRPDLTTINIRGNVGTRIDKAYDPDGPYTAIVLAHAGLERLEKLDVVSEVLPYDVMLPAPGQGALGVQCRAEPESRHLLEKINHTATHLAVIAERAFLAGLGGGCSVPIAAYATIEQDELMLKGRVLSVDGAQQINVSGTINTSRGVDAVRSMAVGLAQNALDQGAARLLETMT